jgi:hypothetical protein
MYFILSHLLSGTYRQFRIQKILYFAIKSVNYISKHAKIKNIYLKVVASGLLKINVLEAV